jgi:hypothetical protein
MAKNRVRRRPDVAAPSPFEQARDELFQHIMRCGVVGADPVHQTEWFDETMKYMTDRFPELESEQLGELRTLGERFSRPAVRAKQDAAETSDASAA